MNKLLLFITVALCISCNNSVNNNTTKQELKNPNLATGIVIKSSVIPHYLLYISDWSQNEQYVEFINALGIHEKVQLYGINPDRYKYIELEFKYDDMNRLVNIIETAVLQESETAHPSDTRNYQLMYSSATDTKPEFTGYEEYKISFSPDFLFIKDFAFETYGSIGRGKLIEYDAIGRPTSLISYKDEGLDSKIEYEKYLYNSDELHWASRKVEQFVITMDNEKISIEMLKNEFLVFPSDFEKEKKVFTQEREVERVYEK